MFFFNPPATEVFYKQKDYTLNEGDHGNVVTFDSERDVLCNIPAGLRIGFYCTIMQLAKGKVLFAALDPGNNINNGAAGVETNGTFAWAKVLCIADGRYAIDYGGNTSGTATGSFILESQFKTPFSMAVDEDIDSDGNPTGTGSLTVTKI
jgi:hypothetical protein